jgi:NADH dehydrogenase
LEGSKSGRVPVDGFNETLNQKNVYALGDIAEMVDEKHPRGHPMLASVAGQQGDWLAKNLNKKAKSKKMKPFVYKDQGTMATIGRNKAVVDLKRFHFSGYIAWLVWMFVHLMLLVEYRNRLIVFANWTWRYIKYDRGSRLIIREYERKQEKDSVKEKN